MLADEESQEIILFNPTTKTHQSFQLKEAGGSKFLHSFGAGRYAAILQSKVNRSQFLDSGIESHGDHADIIKKPSLTPAYDQRISPVHFYHQGAKIAIFNDGDANHPKSELMIADITDIHHSKPLNALTFSANQHGAMIIFKNQTIAVTQKTGKVEGTLPETLQIINPAGTLIFQSKIETDGIHGNAGNADTAVFGSKSGVLILEQTGREALIPPLKEMNPAESGYWVSSIAYGKTSRSFLGIAKKLGVYLIDPINRKIHSIFTSKEIIASGFDQQGKHFFILEADTTLTELEVHTTKVIRSAKFNFDPKQKPNLIATSRFIYIATSDQGLLQIDRRHFTQVNAFKLPIKANKIIMLGVETDEEGH